jgi:hypothetical protein
MLEYILDKGSLRFEKVLDLNKTIKYIDDLNNTSLKVHGEIGTICMYDAVLSLIENYGNLRLGIIESKYLPRRSNKMRKSKVSELFVDIVNLNNIPPIIVSDYNVNEKRDYAMVTLDGATRSEIAYEVKVPLLAYVPEKLIDCIPGFDLL